MTTTRSFLFLLAGARRDGNSERLARRAAAALPADVQQTWLRLDEAALPPFADTRHEPSGGVYPPPEGDARRLLDATLAASDLVFVAPVYWYSLPAPAKLYLDHWSGWMRVPTLNFRARMASRGLWAITAVSDEDRSVAEPLLQTLRLTADYMDMVWRGAAIGYGNRPGDVLNDATGVAQADALFVR
ncbi:NAD(P)H-dependent oxidoreductase [Roseiterribacter gracilis]|uniref:Flavodoxin n=1 Tax=Roseiterribacter gracilis TaxID=2812848 RepID=A0A8S8XDT1_9PROT|nr:flavodoxin [Rhodospirillales bacterium TMPK1]